jgi:hypothetical protein
VKRGECFQDITKKFNIISLYTNQCICFVLKNASQAFPEASAMDIFL